MKKIISLFMIFSLFMTLIAPGVSKASDLSSNTTVNQIEGYTVTTTEFEDSRHVIVTNGEETHEATFDKLTNELTLDGEVVSQELTDDLLELKEDVLTPFYNDPGDWGSYKLFTSFNFEIATSLFPSITISVIITVISSIVGATLGQNIIATIASGILTYLATNKMPTYYFTVKILYKGSSIWTSPYYINTYIYSDAARKNLKTLIWDTSNSL